MGSAILARQTASREHATFNLDRNGHVIKLIVGLIQHYGALTLDEIDVLLYCVGVKREHSEIRNFLLCSIFLRWIIRDKRGLNTFYVAIVDKQAITYKATAGIALIDRDRWRTDIVDYWQKNEPERFNSIRMARVKVIS